MDWVGVEWADVLTTKLSEFQNASRPMFASSDVHVLLHAGLCVCILLVFNFTGPYALFIEL